MFLNKSRCGIQMHKQLLISVVVHRPTDVVVATFKVKIMVHLGCV